MSAWDTQGMASALSDPGQDGSTSAAVSAVEVPTATKTPQEHGWIEKTAYDYNKYNQTNRELAQAPEGAGGEDGQSPAEEVLTEAVGGLAPNDWASNGAKYEWDDSFGDVGPRFPELEKQLFGTENHVKTGIQFENLAQINVTQEGTIRIQPVLRFEDAGLHPVMLENVKLAGYTVPTPVQAYCLPAIKLGHDIIACAQTGSGKTAAFLIPTLSKLMGKAKKLAAPRPNPATFQPGVTPPVKAEPLILVVCPSRELATQIFDEARRFCYRTMLRPCVVYGGGPLADQVFQLQKGCDVLIATPGRLIDFINRPHMLTLKRLKYMIIDEADEMLHSDWETELKQIMEGGDQEEGNITYMMFSATFPKQARQLAREHLAHDLVRIRVGRAGSSHINIKQNVYYIEQSEKKKALYDLLLSTPPARTMVFVNSKRTADEVDDFLFNNDLPCTSIHSDRTQREREDSIRAFRSGKSPILIATGVSARGLDIANVMHIINYDLPSSQYGGINEYIHRIGRTGRIGNVGVASSFYNDKDADIAEVLVKTLLETKQAIPDFLEQYIPEGFTPDGQGKLEELNFEDESDPEEEEGDGGHDPKSGDVAAWGAETSQAQGDQAGLAAAPASSDAWGTTASAAAPATDAAGDAWGGGGGSR
ncbi:P-loop containing nucleoside triphosphate hydrolase protein [Xylogone sp. PMI_703]|nr:P-loop containing nucleoside triphosphate hydrolase protein [Xylogone sp. PMI_703]